jgi:hypothetical protein
MPTVSVPFFTAHRNRKLTGYLANILLIEKFVHKAASQLIENGITKPKSINPQGKLGLGITSK